MHWYILINLASLWFTNSLWQFCMNCITLRSCGYGSQQKRHTKATWIMSNLTGTSWITPGNIKTSTLPTGCPHLWLYQMLHHNTIVGLGRPVPEPKHRCYFSLRRSLTRYNRLLLRNGLLKVVEVQPVFNSVFPIMWYRLMKTIAVTSLIMLDICLDILINPIPLWLTTSGLTMVF